MVHMNGEDRGRSGRVPGRPPGRAPGRPLPKTAMLPDGGIPQSWPPPAQSAPRGPIPTRSTGRRGSSGAPPIGRPPARRRPGRWRRRIGAALLVLLVLIVGFAVYIDFTLGRTDALPASSNASSKGTNWLIVGSD